jgi:hemerythrin
MQKTSELIWQDAQHELLFELIDQIKEKQIDSSVFNKLHDYAEFHFSLEERYMEALDYPGREEHVAAHNRFRKELATMLADHHEYDEALRKSLSLFLREWLKRHVLGIDKKLEQFILDSKLK